MRGVTTILTLIGKTPTISTHTPHARRDVDTAHKILLIITISTHTPHARRDEEILTDAEVPFYFNSHASCEA